MKFKNIISIFLTIFIFMGIIGCDNTDKAYIYFNLSEKPETLDPQTASTDTELMIVRNIFEGLLRKDKNGKVVCGVADSYQKDGLSYTFKLRKDAAWHDETPITAQDFVFGITRAVLPETKSPFVSRLFCIANAKEIYEGKLNSSALGVTATDKYTLKIDLAYEDDNFEETLTSSITMPCNEKFFYESGGKYGIERETTLSNGSYKLSKWAKDIFGIRLYKNKNYSGPLSAKNAAVFLSYNDELTSSDILLDNDADIAFIPPTEIDNLKKAEFKIDSYDNICWFLTLSDGLSSEIRKSLAMLANGKVFEKSLKNGYSVANSIFPPALNNTTKASGMLIYDLETAKQIYADAIIKLTDKRFPKDVVLYYYNDGFSKTVVTDIVGHWQNHLGAFVNIEAVSSPDLLTSQLTAQTYGMSIFPISANSPEMKEYLKKFGIDYNNQSLTEVQINILKSNNIVPIMFQSTSIAYTSNLNDVIFTHGNGCIDFSFIVKTEK